MALYHKNMSAGEFFKYIDRDDSGHISIVEMKYGFAALGIPFQYLVKVM